MTIGPNAPLAEISGLGNYAGRGCGLRYLTRASAGVFRIAARLGEVAISVFEKWVLVTMAELFFEPKVSVVLMLWSLNGAFGAVGIVL